MINDALTRLHGTSANPPVAAPLSALTASTATFSTFYMDLNSPTNVSGGTTTSQRRDIGAGNPLYCVVTCVAATTGTASLSFEIIVSTDTAGSTGVVVLGTTGVLLAASLTAGAQFAFPLANQMGVSGSAPRYLQARFTTGAGTAVLGTYFVDIVEDYSDSKKFYGAGFVVS